MIVLKYISTGVPYSQEVVSCLAMSILWENLAICLFKDINPLYFNLFVLNLKNILLINTQFIDKLLYNSINNYIINVDFTNSTNFKYP